MAKVSLKQREEKREKLVAKYAKKYAELKAIIDDAKKSEEERYAARLELRRRLLVLWHHLHAVAAPRRVKRH